MMPYGNFQKVHFLANANLVQWVMGLCGEERKMKIRLAVLMSDQIYLSGFADLLVLRYADHIELSVFTQAEASVELIQKNRPEIGRAHV